MVIFAVAGSLISAGGQWLIGAFPYAGAAIGLGMVILGLWLLLTHRTLGIMAASRVTISPQRNLGNVFLFGLVYAIGSLSCTLPIFLVVVGSGLAGRSLFAAFGGFISYALGMGSILVAVEHILMGVIIFVGKASIELGVTKRIKMQTTNATFHCLKRRAICRLVIFQDCERG